MDERRAIMVKKKEKLFWNIGIKHVGLLTIYVIMSIILSDIVIRGNDYIAEATDSVLVGQMIAMENLLIPLLAMIVIGTIVAYIKSLSRNHYSSLVQRDVRERLAGHLLKLPYSYFDEKGSGSILTKFSSDIGEAGNFFTEVLPDFLVNIVTVATVTIYFIQMDIRLIVILFASYPVMLIVADKLSKRLAKILKKFRTRMDDRTQVAYDAIQGIAIGRSYNLYDTICARINTAIDDIADHACKSTKISSMGWLLNGVITTIPVVICYFFALFETLSNRITVGEMLAFTILLGRVIYPLGDVVFCLNNFRAAKVSMDRLENLYAAETEEKSTVVEFNKGCGKENKEVLSEKDNNEYDKELGIIQSSTLAIEWEKIKFAYHSSQLVLKEISFCIKQGEMVAFVGGSGEGKSTIFRLLCGLYEKTEGTYKLFGKISEEWSLRELRNCYSVVSQNVFLLPQSIGENVACGKLNATQEEIVEACKAANIHDFIVSLPEGYDTLVGERGIRLSGGQRQRISIARAFLKDAPIILLDEPTSAVDVNTENEIQEAIARIANGKTVIVIAHRLSTIKDADCIYVVNNGTIAESGSHQELLALNGVYANLYGKEVTASEA